MSNKLFDKSIHKRLMIDYSNNSDNTLAEFMNNDFLADNEFFGSCAVILFNVSSKTVYGLAGVLSRHTSSRCEVEVVNALASKVFSERRQ